MTQDQIILFLLFGAVFTFLLWGRFRYDIVAFAALMIAVVLGVVPSADAFSGFGHPATLVVALVLVVSAGLVRAGFPARGSTARARGGRRSRGWGRSVGCWRLL